MSRQSKKYKNTNVFKLEQLLINRKTFVEKSVSYRPKDSNINTTKAFIALVAPSLTGKTQTAYTIDKIRPLYFAFDDSSSKQAIYRKFGSLSENLKEAAEEDFKSLQVRFEDPKPRRNLSKKIDFSEEERILYNISANNIRNSFSNEKLNSLGFLVKLIEDSSEYDRLAPKNRLDWMRFHAERKSFSYSAKSLKEVLEMKSEFLENMQTKYYLFLDEFVGEPWAILIRNIARCLQLGAIVANTNSEIANLIGKLHSASSRQDKWDVWSFVIVNLDKTDWDILNKCCCIETDPKFVDPVKNQQTNEADDSSEKKLKLLIENYENDKNVKLIDKIKRIIDECEDEAGFKVKFSLFFKDLISNEIPRLRPGVSIFIANSISQFDTTKPYELSSFLDYLINDVKDSVSIRKAKMHRKIQGRMGNLALCLSNTYDKEVIKDGIEHRKSYLNDHLFYLCNPADENEWLFLTFPVEEDDDTNLNVHQKGQGNISSLTKEWDLEATYFDESEVFTILMCLFMKPSISIAYSLKQGYNESFKLDFDTSTTQNPLSLKRDGNSFEVYATLSMIDASHRRNGESKATLQGQNGLDFIKNIIGNLILSKKYRIQTGISLTYPSETNDEKSIKSEDLVKAFSIERFLEDCHIPFLYPANLGVPEFLKKLTKNGITYVDSCSRTKDRDQIDFRFNFQFLDNRPNQKGQKETFLAAAECKNWAVKISTTQFLSIIKKAFKINGCFLSLVFCNSLIGDLDSAFYDYCLKESISVYKVKLVNGTSYEINAIFEPLNCPIPELICIVFETDSINNGLICEDIDLDDDDDNNK